MRILIVLLYVLTFTQYASSQEEINGFILQKKVLKKARILTTDPLGNLYLADEQNIWMYNKNGDSLRAFNSRRFGEISFIDATDPYKILVYFQDYNLIIFLDNF